MWYLCLRHSKCKWKYSGEKLKVGFHFMLLPDVVGEVLSGGQVVVDDDDDDDDGDVDDDYDDADDFINSSLLGY